MELSTNKAHEERHRSPPEPLMPLYSPVVRTVVALSLTQLIGWGATFWLPAVTGPAMAADLGLDLTLIMSGPTVMLVVMAALSWPLGPMFERHGARPLMVAGSCLGAVGLCVMAAAGGTATYFLSWVILGFAGAGMLTTPAQIAVAEVAGAGARRALGILILAGGLTSTIIWPVSGLLQAHWGWRTTALIFAGLMLLGCAPLHWAMLVRRPVRRTDAKGATGLSPAIDGTRFILLAASFAANGFFTWGFALTIIVLFEASGLAHTAALTAAAFIGIAQWAGRMFDFVGAGRWSGFTVGLAGSLLFPLSFVILIVSGGFVGAIVFAALYGIAGGITAVNRATLPLHVFAPEAYARAAARLAVPLNLSFAAAPPTFAAILTSAGPHAALWLAFALSVFAFCALLALRIVHGRRGAIVQAG